jgi:hypothetical protein
MRGDEGRAHSTLPGGLTAAAALAGHQRLSMTLE